MESCSTSVGSILSAIVFQIEEENKADPMMQYEKETLVTHRSQINASLNSVLSVNSVVTQGDKDEALNQNDLVDELEAAYQKLTYEHTVVETNFSHKFA